MNLTCDVKAFKLSVSLNAYGYANVHIGAYSSLRVQLQLAHHHSRHRRSIMLILTAGWLEH